MGKVGMAISGGKVTAENLTANNIKAGITVTVKQGKKIVYSVPGNYTVSPDSLYVASGDTVFDFFEVGNVVSHEKLSKYDERFTFPAGEYKCWYDSAMSGTSTTNSNIPIAAAKRWFTFTSDGTAYINFYRAGGGGTNVYQIVAIKL